MHQEAYWVSNVRIGARHSSERVLRVDEMVKISKKILVNTWNSEGHIGH